MLEDIKALRTMITMLSQIQLSKQPNLVLNALESRPPAPNETQSRELKVLSALATILVMKHEVVAVVAKHGHGNGGRIEVFACTDRISVDESTKSSTILDHFFNFVTTMNPRDDVKPFNSLEIYPTIVNATESYNHLKESIRSSDELRAYIKSKWW
jgi:hypothetical protein